MRKMKSFIKTLVFVSSLLSANAKASFPCDENSFKCEKQDVKIDRKNDRILAITCYNSSFQLDTLKIETRGVHSLTIDHCKPSTKSDDFFAGLDEASELQTLKIGDSHLEDVHINALSKFKDLVSVRLTKDQLRYFPENLGDLSIVNLDLSENNIVKLPEKIRFPMLIALKLSNNDIDVLKDSTFADSTNLKWVDLSENNISRLPARLLHPLRNLTTILLSSNEFRFIPVGFFENMTSLREIVINNGRVTSLDSDVFADLVNLDKLRLANNSLRILPEGLFKDLKKLDYLELSSNHLGDLSRNLFRGLENLKQLFLSRNRLTTWPENYNEDLPNLSVLMLNNNIFTEIKAKTFFGLSRLSTLDLSHNRISSVDGSVFAGLIALKKLDLSFNLLMAMNAFDVLEIPRFGRRLSRIDINLSFNNLTHIGTPSLGKRSFTSKTLTSLCFSDNPINCNCQTYRLLEYLNNEGKNSLKLKCDEKCTSPNQWRGTKLTDIDLNEFTCRDQAIFDCPKYCTCTIHPRNETLMIDCSNLGLTKPPLLAPLRNDVGYVKIRKIWVDLANNSIEEFTERDSGYVNVTGLNLSNNKLKKMSWVPLDIEVLNLDNNKLEEIEDNVLAFLNNTKTLEGVTLNDNPWSCDCKMADFAMLLRTRLIRTISNHNLIRCNDGSPLLKKDYTSLCSISFPLLIVLISMSSLVVVLSILLIILYFHYEHHLKIWLYNHRLLLPFIKEDDLDQDYAYDAFVSYSHKDEDFVAKCLVPELENGPEKYELCLHARDWIVGEYIPKQIADSVQNSRRTIIVLSRNFLNSDWANMEFKTAHAKAVSEEKNRLIVILYENVDLTEIESEEIKLYLNTNTYIKWGDPWFWKKLKKALPSRRPIGKVVKRNQSKDIEKNVNS